MYKNTTLDELYFMCINDDIKCEIFTIPRLGKTITLSTDTLCDVHKYGNEYLLNSIVKWFRFDIDDNNELNLIICLYHEEWMKVIKSNKVK